MKILFQLSGSISCYKSCFLISKLIQEQHEVKVICTPSALKFVGKATLEGLSGSSVLFNTFTPSHMMDHIRLSRWADLLILCPASANTINELASGITSNIIGALFLSFDWSKPYLLVPAMNSQMLSHPATQSSLKKLKSWGVSILETDYGSLACGEVGYGRLLDLDEIERKIHEEISLLSFKKKKKEEEEKENQSLSRNEISKNNSKDIEQKIEPLRKEKKEHKKQINTESLESLKNLESLENLENLEGDSQNRVLITAGGTKEAIDSVRYISNISTGLTGARLCETMSLKGFHVTYLHSFSSHLPFENAEEIERVSENFDNVKESRIEREFHRRNKKEKRPQKTSMPSIQKVSFESFSDFQSKIESLLKNNTFQAVIHLAALSDYSIHSIEQKGESFLPGKHWKCSSEKGSLLLHLKKNKKLLFHLKEMSKNKSIRIFAFKLTYNVKKNALLKIIQSLFKKTSVDFIIQNDLYEIQQEFKKWKDKKQEEQKRRKTLNKASESERDFHIFRIFGRDPNQPPLLTFSKKELSHTLSHLLLKLLHEKKSNNHKKKSNLSHKALRVLNPLKSKKECL